MAKIIKTASVYAAMDVSSCALKAWNRIWG